VWRVESDPPALVENGSPPLLINVTDVEDASVFDGVVAVVGDGVELFHDEDAAAPPSLSLAPDPANLVLAAKLLRHANYVLVTTGAGMSADSGLSTCVPRAKRAQKEEVR
jgi:hypothetical protein